MSTLSNLDIFGLLMIASVAFLLPMALIGDRDDPVEETAHLHWEKLARPD